MEHGFIFDLNPVIVTIGPLQLRYYGLIFAAMLGIGFLLWRWQMLRGGYSSDLARKFFIWGVIAVMAGIGLLVWALTKVKLTNDRSLKPDRK